MDARLVCLLPLLVLAAAAPLLASAQLANGFYSKSCPDAEKIVFGIVEKKFKEDPGTAAGLLRLVFHDCFANGCDASVLVDPLSNQASEKEAGPNISLKGFDVIDEIKAELEKQCPGTVSCADVVVLGARDSVKLTGGPDIAVPTGRRDSLVSNREDADNLPGPDIPVPKLTGEFSQQGFDLEEMVALIAGGHTIGMCKCFFIEIDASPIDPEYKQNVTGTCDGPNAAKAALALDMITPNVFDPNYFGLVLAKKMPLTIDRLLGIDPKVEPVIKAMMQAKPAEFAAKFAKAMEKLVALKPLTGKDGEIRKVCGEFNNPQKASDDAPSVIRVSSFDEEMGTPPSPPAGGGSGNDDKASTGAETAGLEPAKVPETPVVPPKVASADEKVVKKVEAAPSANVVATNNLEINKGGAASAGVEDSKKILGDEPGSRLPGGPGKPIFVQTAEANAAAALKQSKKVLGDEPGSKLPGGPGKPIVVQPAALEESKLKILGDEPGSKLPGGPGKPIVVQPAAVGAEAKPAGPTDEVDKALGEEKKLAAEEKVKRPMLSGGGLQADTASSNKASVAEQDALFKASKVPAAEVGAAKVPAADEALKAAAAAGGEKEIKKSSLRSGL